MLFLKTIFVLLHILTAAAWFGLGLRLAAQARRALTLSPPAAQALLEEGVTTVRQMGMFLVATLIFGLSALFTGGGFAVYGPPYHTSLLLLLVLIGLQWGLLRPAWRGLQQALGSSAPKAQQVERFRKRVAAAVGVGHFLWVVILVLMYWYTLAATLQ